MRKKFSILAFILNAIGLITILLGIFLIKDQNLINLGIAVSAVSCSYLLLVLRNPKD